MVNVAFDWSSLQVFTASITRTRQVVAGRFGTLQLYAFPVIPFTTVTHELPLKYWILYNPEAEGRFVQVMVVVLNPFSISPQFGSNRNIITWRHREIGI